MDLDADHEGLDRRQPPAHRAHHGGGADLAVVDAGGFHHVHALRSAGCDACNGGRIADCGAGALGWPSLNLPGGPDCPS